MITILLFALVSMFAFQAPPDGSDIGPIVGLIMARALQLTTVIKVLVDVFGKIAFGWTGRALPAVACLLGVAIDFAVLAIGGSAFTKQSVVLAIVAGLIGGGGAIGVTELHKAAQ